MLMLIICVGEDKENPPPPPAARGRSATGAQQVLRQRPCAARLERVKLTLRQTAAGGATSQIRHGKQHI